MEIHDYITIGISCLAILVSIGVLAMHWRRDVREKSKQKLDEKNLEKRVKISTSKARYEFEQNINPENGEYYEDHIVFFDYKFRNNGAPTIYPEIVIISFLKPLIGEEIKSFTFNINPSKMKMSLGEEISLRFGQGFGKYELADEIMKSSLKIKLIDIQGDHFETPLLKLEIEVT
ncbi:MAG: hypothetical protein Q8S14_02270 [Algoriphagus sp.]|uniref:hypothetical protein n=1 Tax=Algoriphagus sp. TaxID=1872435 RepID=UPI00272F2DFD|nr:hypothetical protein [Algoriphagus sp.]MDP2040401.1 hypothetical protein [Algoriphagus sp.]MDP3470672.1 hypothetical protein [Algoriphagus sp.]